MPTLTTTCLINNYNYGRFVCEAIDGALSQTRAFDEIIVVDDGSTDGSVDLLKSQYGKNSAVRVIAKSNRGQLSAFNEGFAQSAGDLIFFLDADDVYEPHYVAKALDVYLRHPDCGFLSCGLRRFGQDDQIVLTHPDDRDLGYSVIIAALRARRIGGPTSSFSMKRHILETILPLPLEEEWRIRADDCLVFGASLAGARKRYLAEPLVRYRVHGKNHFYGKKKDNTTAYLRVLQLNRLFHYLFSNYQYDFGRLACHASFEFRTIERPTVRQLQKYTGVCMQAPMPLVRRLLSVAEMCNHFIKEKRAIGQTAQDSVHNLPSPTQSQQRTAA